MSNAKLKYVGPGRAGPEARPVSAPWYRRLPLAFVLVVVLPTLLAAIYFLLIASPRYVAEARFVVRAPNAGAQPSALGMALQGVGIPAAGGDAFAVHEYVTSREAVRELSERVNLKSLLGRSGVDSLSRFPRPWEGESFEDLHKGFERYVVVGYDSTTGISTLRVEAFTARDSYRIAEELLQGGERLVNRMNERAATDTITHAREAQTKAMARLETVQTELANFRNNERILDPELTAKEGSEVVARLRGAVAELRAQRAQIAATAPQSPELVVLDGRIAGYETQIEAERAKLTGSNGALAPRVGTYQQLILRQELADKEYAQATASLIGAEQDAQRQKLYLDRIVNPSLPDEPILPQRWLSLLAVFLSALLVYGLGRLVWAGLREHHS